MPKSPLQVFRQSVGRPLLLRRIKSSEPITTKKKTKKPRANRLREASGRGGGGAAVATLILWLRLKSCFRASVRLLPSTGVVMYTNKN